MYYAPNSLKALPALKCETKQVCSGKSCKSALQNFRPFSHPFGSTFGPEHATRHTRGASRNLRKHHMAWDLLGSARDFLGSAWDFSGSASKISFYALSGVPRLIFWPKRCPKKVPKWVQKGSKRRFIRQFPTKTWNLCLLQNSPWAFQWTFSLSLMNEQSCRGQLLLIHFGRHQSRC